MAKLLTREQILRAPVASLEHEVPEWGGTVRVRALSPRLRLELLDAIHQNDRAVEDFDADQALPEDERKNLPKVERYDQTVLTMLYVLVNEKGERVFRLEDYDAACDLSLPTMNSLWQVLTSLENGTADLKKSFKTRQSAASSSD